MERIDSRAAVRNAIEKRYTLPSDKASGVVDTPLSIQQAKAH